MLETEQISPIIGHYSAANSHVLISRTIDHQAQTFVDTRSTVTPTITTAAAVCRILERHVYGLTCVGDLQSKTNAPGRNATVLEPEQISPIGHYSAANSFVMTSQTIDQQAHTLHGELLLLKLRVKRIEERLKVFMTRIGPAVRQPANQDLRTRMTHMWQNPQVSWKQYCQEVLDTELNLIEPSINLTRFRLWINQEHRLNDFLYEVVLAAVPNGRAAFTASMRRMAITTSQRDVFKCSCNIYS